MTITLDAKYSEQGKQKKWQQLFPWVVKSELNNIGSVQMRPTSLVHLPFLALTT